MTITTTRFGWIETLAIEFGRPPRIVVPSGVPGLQHEFSFWLMDNALCSDTLRLRVRELRRRERTGGGTAAEARVS